MIHAILVVKLQLILEFKSLPNDYHDHINLAKSIWS